MADGGGPSPSQLSLPLGVSAGGSISVAGETWKAVAAATSTQLTTPIPGGLRSQVLPLPFPSAALSCQSKGNPSANAAPTFPTPLTPGAEKLALCRLRAALLLAGARLLSLGLAVLSSPHALQRPIPGVTWGGLVTGQHEGGRGGAAPPNLREEVKGTWKHRSPTQYHSAT